VLFFLALLLVGTIGFLALVLCKKTYLARGINFIYSLAGLEPPTQRPQPASSQPSSPLGGSDEEEYPTIAMVDLRPSAPPLDPILEDEEEDEALEVVISGDVYYEGSEDEPISSDEEIRIPSPLRIAPPSPRSFHTFIIVSSVIFSPNNHLNSTPGFSLLFLVFRLISSKSRRLHTEKLQGSRMGHIYDSMISTIVFNFFLKTLMKTLLNSITNVIGEAEELKLDFYS
jgi:hypothetical protein